MIITEDGDVRTVIEDSDYYMTHYHPHRVIYQTVGGKLHGEHSFYSRKEGTLILQKRTNYLHGEVVKTEEWWDNGQKKYECHWINGSPLVCEAWLEDGSRFI